MKLLFNPDGTLKSDSKGSSWRGAKGGEARSPALSLGCSAS